MITFGGVMPDTNQLKLQSIDLQQPDRAHITVNNFDVYLVKTDEGLVVDIFDPQNDDDTLATTYAFDYELTQ